MKATIGQILELGQFLVKSFFPIISAGKKEVEGINGDNIQKAVTGQYEHSILDELIKFINNGFQVTYLVAKRVLDLDREPKLPFERATIQERKGLTGPIELDLTKLRAVSKLKNGESHIIGHEFRKRLLEDDDQLIGSDLIDLLVKNQDDPDVKAFLDQYRGKVLFDFSTTFSYSFGYLCVRCLVVFGGRWVSRYSWLDDVFLEHRLALVLADLNSIE